MITITKEQMEYLNEKGVDIRGPLKRGDLQGVLDTIDDEIVCLIQCDPINPGVTVSELQWIYDEVLNENHSEKIQYRINSEDVREALTNPEAEIMPIRYDRYGRASQRYRYGQTEVSINPETGMLLNANPYLERKKTAWWKRLGKHGSRGE